MTTEIAVSNKLGIALATDSAVTISGNGSVKVFDTADKLFELSSHFPIAVMINGNMDCVGVPWEILVKDFRDFSKDRSHKTVEEWAKNFLQYILNHQIIDEKIVGKHIDNIIESEIEEAQLYVAQIVRGKIFDDARQNRRVKLPIIGDLLNEYFDKRTKWLDSIGIADSLIEISLESVINTYSHRIDELTKKRFTGRELTTDELGRFKEIVAQLLVKAIPTESTTGIVVAGFGSDETFPSVYSAEVDGIVAGRVKIYNKKINNISSSPTGGQVIYFAQTDVIQRLLGGADPRFIDYTSEFIGKAVFQVADTLEKALRSRALSKKTVANRRKVVQEIVDEITSQYQNETTGELREQFSREFDRMIAMMPKQELIELAEALVSITAVERKATSDEGTVGGPIDVAFITKHEGFVWIRRKHYFDPSLNPRYFWRKFGNATSTGGINAVKTKNA